MSENRVKVEELTLEELQAEATRKEVKFKDTELIKRLRPWPRVASRCRGTTLPVTFFNKCRGTCTLRNLCIVRWRYSRA